MIIRYFLYLNHANAEKLAGHKKSRQSGTALQAFDLEHFTQRLIFFRRNSNRRVRLKFGGGSSSSADALFIWGKRCILPSMRMIQNIDYSEARRIVDVVVEEAARLHKAAAIAVADAHGDLICFARMDGAPISSIRIAMNKAWTAARERKPTKEIGEKAKHPEKGHDISYYGDPNYVGWGGGIPLWKNGEVIGAVAVSGLSSNEDISLAALGVELIAGS